MRLIEAPAATPVGEAEFAAAMAAIGGFERAPRLGIAVSGGPDSMALAHLAQHWAAARGGSSLALIVDHGLRPEAASEALRTRTALLARGLEVQIIRLDWQPPVRSVQAAARIERYRCLAAACSTAGILHLLLGHQREDQAETFLLRLGRGSGLDGLAAMAPVSYRRDLRLVRPLLGVARERLAATCAAYGQVPIADPSNRDPRHARARLRAALPSLGEDGLATERLAATAEHLGRARAAIAVQLAAFYAGAVRLDPAGFARLDAAALGAAPGEIGRRALAGLLMTIGGTPHPPRFDRLDRLYGVLSERGNASWDATLGGCRISVDASDVTVAREVAAMAAPVALRAAEETVWDGRFSIRAEGAMAIGLAGAVTLGALGGDAAGIAAAVRRQGGALQRAWRRIPPAARPTLPCLRRVDSVFYVPHLTYCVEGSRADTLVSSEILFDPALPLTGPVLGASR